MRTWHRCSLQIFFKSRHKRIFLEVIFANTSRKFVRKIKVLWFWFKGLKFKVTYKTFWVTKYISDFFDRKFLLMFILRYKYDWVILSITLTRRVYLHSLNFWLDFSSELILLLDIWNLDLKHLFGSLQGGWSLFVSGIVFSLQIQTNKNILNVFYSPLYEPISNRNAFPSLNKILIHIRLMYFFKKD